MTRCRYTAIGALFVICLLRKVDVLNVTVIYFSLTNEGSLSFNYYYPAFDAVVKDIKTSRPDVFENLTLIPVRWRSTPPLPVRADYLPGFPPFDPVTDNMADLFWNFYFHNEELFPENLANHVVAIVATDWGDGMLELARDTANIPVAFFTTSPQMELFNNRKYPTTLNIFPTPRGNFFFAIQALANKYRWHQMHLVCDMESNTETDCLTIFDANAPRKFSGLIKIVYSFVRTGSDGRTDFEESLKRAANFRATLVLSRAVTFTRQFMVFLALQLLGIPARDTIKWKLDDPDDNAALEAFESLLILADSAVNISQLGSFWPEVQESYIRLNNWTMDMETSNIGNMIWAYENLWFIAEEILFLKDDLAELTALSFVQRSLNHTFALRSRNFTFQDDGKLIVDTPILHTNKTTGIAKHVMSCNPSTGEITVFDLNWFGSRALPPDFPPCGARGEKCFSAKPGATAGLSCVIIALVLAAGAGFIYYSKRLTLQRFQNVFLRDEDITMSESEDKVSRDAIYKEEVPIQVRVIFSPTTQDNLLTSSTFCKTALQISLGRNKNIAEFIGVLVRNNTVYFVSQSEGKGHLMDLLQHADIFHSHDLRRYLASDLIEGTAFIHKSYLGFHGDISLANCWISQRYSLRIAMTGFSHLQWILSGSSLQARLHQTAEDIFQIGNILKTVFIEQCNLPEPWSPGLSIMIDSCLRDNPAERPTAFQLQKMMGKVVKSDRSIVEDVLSQLSKHAEQLESTVASRTTDLIAETNKVDALLKEMLPISVIKQLRRKEHVLPEMFESVTILFSDIPIFGEIIEKCSLLEVTDFLNTIHSKFDEIIQLFDVYKVETINDSYVVSSGLPIRNGTKHAPEICLLSFQLLSAAKLVSIPNEGGRVSPRIGISSGPIATAVIGSRMPRYCIFGDVMNTASRMESHGKAGRVHCSSSTQQLALAVASELLHFESRGFITIKGKGELETFWVHNRNDF